jgi:FkbM family methyltransferase
MPLPPDCFSASHRLYRRLLAAYTESRSAPFRRGVERLVDAGIRWGRRRNPTVFPEALAGGWGWTSRWRFEVLLEWNEAESVCWCRRLIRPGMRVLDVGAHIGYYTRLFARLAGRSGEVWAFEPHPENFAILRENLRGRHAGNVHLLQRAVGEASGKVRLHLSPGSSNHSLVPGYTESQGALEVDSVALDSFLGEQGVATVDFVKIDVEGAEPRVLAGMERLLAASPNAALLIELNPRALACGGSSPEALLDRIGRLGFEPRALLPDARLVPPRERGGEGDVNLLCRRP